MVLDGTLLRIDRVAMASGNDRPYYLRQAQDARGERAGHRRPPGRLIWASPALPGARHDVGAARDHGILDALDAAGVTAYADTAYHRAGPAVRVPHRRVRHDRRSHRFRPRPLSAGQKAANRAHSALRAPGERAHADLKN